jgi:hypothetical protein
LIGTTTTTIIIIIITSYPMGTGGSFSGDKAVGA